MDHCAQCDSELREGARFCDNCGAAVDDQATAASSAEPTSDMPVGDVATSEQAIEVPTEKTPAEPERSAAVASQPETTDQQPAVGQAGTQPPSGDRVAITFPRPSPVAMWSVALLAVSAFFPWLTSPFRLSRAVDIPFAFLYDLEASRGGLSVGVILLALAGLSLIATLVPRLIGLRRALAFLVILVSAALALQWYRYLSDLDATDQLLSYVGVGVYAAFVAGILLFSAPARSSTS